MKKYLYLVSLVIALSSCSKENTDVWSYAVEDVKIMVEIPDTLYVGKPAEFGSTINVPLPVTFYIGSVPEKIKIGEVKPPKGSFTWIPTSNYSAAGKETISVEVVIENNGEGKITTTSRSKDVIIN